MAPVEVDYVRRSEDPGSPAEPTAGGSGAPESPGKKFEQEDGGAGPSNDMPDSPESLGALDKAMELPLVKIAYSEVTRIASPTLAKYSPMLEGGYQIIKSQVEEKVVPHISESVSKNISSTRETVSAAVEKADTLACAGIDQITEKVPMLKDTDATQKLLEESKVSLLLFLSSLASTKSISTCSGNHHRSFRCFRRWRYSGLHRLRPLPARGPADC